MCWIDAGFRLGAKVVPHSVKYGRMEALDSAFSVTKFRAGVIHQTRGPRVLLMRFKSSSHCVVEVAFHTTVLLN
jgi:hypothetical protein